jgi:hypothetical protein
MDEGARLIGRADGAPALLDALHHRYFLFRAYLSNIAGQGSSPQASVAESSVMLPPAKTGITEWAFYLLVDQP